MPLSRQQVGHRLCLFFLRRRDFSSVALAENPCAHSFQYERTEEPKGQVPGPNGKYQKLNPILAEEEVASSEGPAVFTSRSCMLKPAHGTDLDERIHKRSELVLHKELTFVEVQTQSECPIANLTRILLLCKKEKSLPVALHACTLIHEMGLELHASLGNSLVTMLVEAGSLQHAQRVFNMLECKRESSWSSLIIGFSKSGDLEHAWLLYELMQEAFSQNTGSQAMVGLLNACGRSKQIERGCSLHVDIARKGLLDSNVYVGSTLVDMYARCGLLGHAQEVFDMIPIQTVVSWNALIAGFVEHGHEEIALSKFEQMQCEGHSPSVVTFVCILKACIVMKDLDKGQVVHIEILRRGLESGMFIGSILVDMYAKSDLLLDAQNVFDSLPDRDTVSWTALIAGYGEYGRAERTFELFERMLEDNVTPSAVTYVCCLKACGRARLTRTGQEIHSEVVKKGLERDPFIGSTLVEMYARGSSLLEAQCVFDKILKRDVVLWTSLLAAYTDNGYFEEALNYFDQMQQEGASLEVGVLVCSLKACGGTESIMRGRDIHSHIVKAGLESRLPIGNVLVDIYTKCGAAKEAYKVFGMLTIRDVISWTALLAGYAQLGESEHVIEAFDKMIGEGIEPNLITFLCVLNACSNAGLIEEGQKYFHFMINTYLLTPTLEHFACVCDLLGRMGLIGDALELTMKMPFHPTVVVWLTVLAACRKGGNIQYGKHAFEQAVCLNQKKDSVFLCMFNIYADANVLED